MALVTILHFKTNIQSVSQPHTSPPALTDPVSSQAEKWGDLNTPELLQSSLLPSGSRVGGSGVPRGDSQEDTGHVLT